MPTLLLPYVAGPVYTVDTQVKVSGALQGATVQVFKNGAPTGTHAVADSTGIAVIGLNPGTLSLGDAITAIQSKDGDQTQQGPGTTVLDIASSLSPPIFLSQVHTCMDAVVLGGIQIGAEVEVTSGGKRLGDALADATEITVSLVKFAGLPVGAVLEARQTISVGGQRLVSSRTRSFPAEQTPLPQLEHTFPAPQIVPPLFACDQSVLVTGIIDGMQMRLESSEGGGGIYLFGGNTLPARTIPLKEGEKVRAVQFSQNCNFDSIASNEVTVGKATSLPPPIIVGPICTELSQIVVNDLAIGAEVHLYAGRDGSETLIGSATAAYKTQTFGVPSPLPSFSAGPTAYLTANQNRCGIGNVTATKTPMDQRPGHPLPPGFGQLFECARIVQVLCTDRAFGCALQILSDDPKTPILSPLIILTRESTVVTLYRQLLAGENITAVLTGCGAGPEARRTKRVGTLLLPKPIVLEPLRSWAKTVFVGNTMEGAQVYLFINGKYAGHVEATEGTAGIRFPVSDLNPEDKVTAQQCLCTQFSEVSRPAIVTLGQMNAFVSPDPIVRGPNPQTVGVVVKDAEDGHAVAGSVHLPNSVTHPTNTPFSWVFPLSQAGPAASVTAPDYVTKNVIWNLVDPPPPPLPPPPAALTLELVNQVTNVILKKAEWDISHITSLGSGPSVVDTKSGNPASSVLPIPSGPQDLYFVGCSATFEFGGKSQTVQTMVAPLIDFPFKATIGWQGKPEKALFVLRVANSINDQGQVVSEFYIQLIEVKLI